MTNYSEYQPISVERLVSFKGHPFKLYEGQRLADMVESVRNNGVLVPIVVRPVENDKFEILSGHNRVAAAREAGLCEVLAVVRDGLSDEEALLVVTETNLIQRSFADLKHSERALAIAAHHNATKHQGKRTDLLKEIDDLLETSRPMGGKFVKLKGEKTTDKYEISSRTISRYLRINQLIPELKERLDNNEFAIRVGEALSFLRKKEQEYVNEVLETGKNVSIKQADALHEESRKGKLKKAYVKEVLEPGYFGIKTKSYRINGQFLSLYFDEDASNEDVERTIAEALAQYFTNKKL